MEMCVDVSIWRWCSSALEYRENWVLLGNHWVDGFDRDTLLVLWISCWRLVAIGGNGDDDVDDGALMKFFFFCKIYDKLPTVGWNRLCDMFVNMSRNVDCIHLH